MLPCRLFGDSMTNNLISKTIALTDQLAVVPWQPKKERSHYPKKVFAIGDPQTTRARLFSILQSHDLLADSGMIKPEVALVSIGDHFDYAAEPAEVRIESTRILRWLAEHPADQVFLIAGNHDLCRVMELAPFSDKMFQAAQQEAKKIKASEYRGEDITQAEEAFYQRYPSLPSPGVAVKDFLGFSEEQRTLVQKLLLAGRFRLGLHVKTKDQHDALLTHASVTHRELGLLGLSFTSSAQSIALALNQTLTNAVEKVRPDWSCGRINTPLCLSPLHVAGFAEQEGGGLLYHRPADPERTNADKQWEFDPKMPRRFDPRTLPMGLVQIIGHTGHSKCVKSLGAWLDLVAQQTPCGGLRTLSATPQNVRYSMGINPPNPQEATVYMIDIEINNKELSQHPLLELLSLY
jgi:hypothetical protein